MTNTPSVEGLAPCPSPPQWIVWSNEHRAFWAPERRGYTQRIDKAGRYSREEAETICKSANYRANSTINVGTPPEICMPAPEALDTTPPGLRDAPEGASGRFADYATKDLAAQCRMQARYSLDPEYCQFMTAVAKRLSAQPHPVRADGDWVLVPVKLTKWMRGEGMRAHMDALYRGKTTIDSGMQDGLAAVDAMWPALLAAAPKPDQPAEVDRVAAILERWDMTDPPNEFTGHDYRDIARDIVGALTTDQPAAGSEDELQAQAETYRYMHEIATEELGYPSILEALEMTPTSKGRVRMRSQNGGDAWVADSDVVSFEEDGWSAISEIVPEPSPDSGEIARLRAALILAANRMDCMAIDISSVFPQRAKSYEAHEWAQAARLALQPERPEDASS